MADISREQFENASVPRAESTNRLKVGAIGLFGVLFMSLANAAPITSMTGNVPIMVAYGNGVFAPAGYLIATVVMTLFTIGYAAMSRYVTTAGAFYGFISHGLGQIWGMATGGLAAMAYIVFEGSIIGIFAYFAHSALSTWFSINVNWLIIAIIGILLEAIFGYFDINIAAALLGFLLVCEVVLLTALALSVLFKGGGPNGLMMSSLNPMNAIKSLPAGGGFGIKMGTAALPAGAAAIGLFFAVWSWVGYETTAVYGEESRNPRRIVPKATLIAVVGLGLFYTFVSWLVIAGNGSKVVIDKAANNSIAVFTDLAKANLGGGWVTPIYLFLIVSGSFACALAFHNAAARYMYAIGREVPGLQKTLGATHGKHHTPYIASSVQSLITLILTLGFYFLTHNGSDATQGAYIYEYGLLAVLGTLALLIVMVICSFSVIWYFHVKKVHEGNMITTGLIPALGAIGMIYVVYLLLSNLAFAGGAAAGSPFFKTIPWITLATFLFGLFSVLWLRSNRPEVYDAIGRTVLEESHERA